MIKLGSHVSMNGREMLLGSVDEALSYGANAFMIYTGAPQNTRRKPIEDLNIDLAKRRMEEAGIRPEDVIVHAPYVMNLANPDPTKRAFAQDFLVSEIERTAAIGAKHIVLHPGAHVKEGAESAIERIVDGLEKVIERTKAYDVHIALETMAGKGTEVGRSFEELRAIIDGVEHDERLSVCFDTCHTHDAGYDVKGDFDGVMAEFDRIVGQHRIGVFHINDSKNPRGAGKDRHANLGTGYIGFEALNAIIHHPDFTAIPKILETPYVTETDDSTKRVYAPYKEEIAMVKKGMFDPSFIDAIRAKHQRATSAS